MKFLAGRIFTTLMANTLELVRRAYMWAGVRYLCIVDYLDVLPWLSVFLKSVEGTRR